MQLPARPPAPPTNASYDYGNYPVSQSTAVPRSAHVPSLPPMPPAAMLPQTSGGYPASQPPPSMPPQTSAGFPASQAPPSMPPAAMVQPAQGHPMSQPHPGAPASHSPQGMAVMGLPRPDGPQLQASQYRAPGTGLWTALSYVGLGLLTLFTLGATLGLLALVAVSEWLLRRRLRMQIVGSCLRVSADQLPEVHQAASVIAQRLGLAQLPEIYILETNTMSAVAARVGGRNMVILTDDAIDGCLRSGDIRTLNFILARELAHHALGHTGLIRNAMKMALPPLSRLDELSADAVATAIVGQPEVAANALITMLTGPQLLRFVNRQALMQQAYEVASAKAAKKAEQPMRQPLIMRRIARIYQLGQ